MPRTSVLLVSAALVLLVTTWASAASNILFIVDASGSMWGEVEGKAKIASAKEELQRLMAELPADTGVGMMVYGHRAKGDCSDIETVVPIGGNADAVAAAVKELKPLGKTPIAASIEQSAAAFDGLSGQSNNVILISDGVESCDGDPCASAAALAANNVGVRIHVVGFDLTPEENAKLKCIAANGNGSYFSANSTAGLADAITQVAQAAQTEEPVAPPEPAPEPVKPREVVFTEEFDGDDVSPETWEVANPNIDNYIVENDYLLMISGVAGGLATPTLPNMLKLLQDPPEGDYTVTVKFRMEFATGAEAVVVGLYTDPENFISASIASDYQQYAGDFGRIELQKMSQGQQTGFTTYFLETSGTGYGDLGTFVADLNAIEQPITLKLIKEGRTFRASANLAGQKDENGEPIWHTTEPVSSLRAPKSIVLAATQTEASFTGGETTFYIDSVTIDVPAAAPAN